MCALRCVQLFTTPWTITCQAPLSLWFPRQEYWSGLPFPSPGGSSRPRDWTCISWVSCIGRRILYPWATWEAWNVYHQSNLIISLIGKVAFWWHLCDFLTFSSTDFAVPSGYFQSTQCFSLLSPAIINVAVISTISSFKPLCTKILDWKLAFSYSPETGGICTILSPFPFLQV